ncbi:MAG TPA: hypothetical protein VL463_06660 [Kofleriaceae bacterium]|jgi:hypothetical protein|nr:hypothetical protein [Kofleriaceae bacterium]
MNEKRGLAVAATAIIALGAGLIAYRWIVLGFTWSGRGSTVMLGVSIGAVVAGSQIARATTEAMKRVPWWLRIVVLVGGLAIGGGIGFAIAPTIAHVALDDYEAGNITLGLPSGERIESSGKTYVKNAGGFESLVGVTWQVGSLDPATMKAVTSALAAGMQGSVKAIDHDDFVVGVGGDAIAHQSATIEKDGGLGWMTMFTCGQNLYGVYTFGHGAETLQRRVLATVHCNAKATDKPAEVPVAFDPPPGWQSAPTDPGQLAWANQDAALMVRPVDSVPDDKFADVMRAIGPAMGGSIDLGAMRVEQGRSFWSGSMTVQGETMSALISQWPCGNDQALMAMYLHAPGTDEQPGVETIMRVQCKR